MTEFTTPWEFWDEVNKRPDVQEIMKRLAASGWDDPSAYEDSPYATDAGDDWHQDVQQTEQTATEPEA